MTTNARILFRNEDYDGQLARTLSAAAIGAADLGEAMATARRIRRCTGSIWYDEWSATADRASDTAAAALDAGDLVGAASAYLRASEYYRQAYYFVRGDLADPRLRTGHRRHVETFDAASGLLDHPAERVTIPFGGHTLTGYLHRPDTTAVRRPTVLAPAGYDSTAASYLGVPDALARGFNVLTFEGPGQGGVLLDQGLHFSPEYELVLTAAVDWLLARPEVDPHGLVLFGRSFAGYLAPRGAAFEHRLAALVCDPAQPNMGARIPDGLVGRVAAPVARAQMAFSPKRAEFFRARMATHGLDSITDYLAELRRFDMLGVADRISCPTLIIEAEGDFAGGGGRDLYDALTCPKDLVELTAAAGAGGHCGGLGQQIWAGTVYGWLRRTLGDRVEVA